MDSIACKELEAKVIKESLCTFCGACTGMCPYLVAYRGRTVLRDTCNLSEGRCQAFCPRLSLNLDEIHKAVFGTPYKWDSIGKAAEVYIARSTDKAVQKKAQYGGVVTALISFALKEGFIDGAVLTRSNDDGLPEGTLVTTAKEILGCAGSGYTASPAIGAFNQAVKAGNKRKLAVVGTPCQVLALSKMKTSPSDLTDNSKGLSLTIGLFCTWALSTEEFISFLKERVSLPDIKKVDIPPPPANVFDVYTASGKVSIPLDEVRKFIRPACTFCTDMTAEFADISVGAAEGIEGWNTVIVRTEKGAEFFKKAKAKKILEIRPMPGQSLEHLKEAALSKKKRALRNIIRKTGNDKDLLYIKASPKTVKEFLDG
jgi:coenzyme F420 hydrogenase subunit beta